MELNILKEKLVNKVNELGYDLVSINLEKNKGDLTLSIVVDRVSPINMEDIVNVTNSLNSYLDELDPIKEAYQLDVSSLGAEKPLDVNELANYKDSYVHVHLVNPIKGENIFEGDLSEVNEETILLTYRQKTRSITIEILKTNISFIRLAIKF